MASQTFPADLASLSQILEWIRARIDETLLAPVDKGQLVLAVEEAVVNVISHANGLEPLEVSLEVRHMPNQQIEVEVRDRAEPFNPLEKPVDPEVSSLEKQEPGGLGIHLMHNCVDSLLYRFDDGENVLTLIKSL